MNAEFNKSINWYFGIDGKNTPDSLYDFVSVVLHEIGHGLGFTGFFFVDKDLGGGYGLWDYGDATSFDLLVVQNNGDQLVDTTLFANPSDKLKTALISGALYANSPVAKIGLNGNKPRLYVPTTWDNGSSIYHLNDATYPAGNPNSLMTHAAEQGMFSATLTPAAQTDKIDYYISAQDKKNRTFMQPAEAPKTWFTINIGPDTEPPVIEHQPIAYFLLSGNNLIVNVKADDNLGVDTVFVEYSINGEPQNSFGLTHGLTNNFAGKFNFNASLLKDGDVIDYNIVAKDASAAGNTKRFPATDQFSFKVEQIFDPIASYFSDFNYPSTDFVISDFKILLLFRLKQKMLRLQLKLMFLIFMDRNLNHLS
ncbi:MAG: hypothetical protein J7L95_02745 [Prolixibacteraceae bacterium]|nr:hypothetical protein [Prolixibacteraceae bacterium]